MDIPNYTYLMLKMPGRHGVITISSRFNHALQCERSSCELASTIVASTELRKLREDTVETVPDSNKSSDTAAFKPVEDLRSIELDPEDPSKTIQVRTALPSK